MDVGEFLSSTITTPTGTLCLALRAPNVNWHELYFEWPNQRDEAMAVAYNHRDEYDVYFTSYLFDGPGSSAKDKALPSRTIQADLDGADIRNLPLKPGTLVKTSPGRYQAYWYLDDKTPSDLELLELLSRRLTYAIKDSDKSGWSVGHKVRVVDTFNHKYIEGKHLVEVVDHDPRMYSITELEMLPEVDSLTLDRFDNDFISNPPIKQVDGMGPNELLSTIKSKLPVAVYSGYDKVAKDRSAALWALMCAGFRAGLNRQDVYWLALHSANNKFARLHYHAERELAKDVLRAENEVFTTRADPRELVMEIRKNGILAAADKKRAVTGFVYSHMKEEGDFIKTPTHQVWYIPRDTGKPVSITQRSEKFDSLLDIRYGLNRTESYHEFTVFGIINQQVAQPSNGRQAALSYYEPGSHALYLHSGRKDVYVITADGVRTVTDGARGIVFPWDVYTPFNLTPPGPDGDWADLVFGKLDNVVHFTAQEAQLLLKVWLLFLLFRDAASARPILALFGQPGSGKTSTMHRIHALLYGYSASVLGVTNPAHFDQSASTRPLLALDNVDTWESWLPDRLAQSASVTDIDKRKLFSDTDTIRMQRQAMVALTAHAPKFTREDITDRLLLLNFTRLHDFLPETPMIEAIQSQRNKLWYAITQDIQAILQNPIPDTTDIRYRIADFARLGGWIAQGLGQYETFREMMEKTISGQVAHNLQADQVLVGAVAKYAEKGGTHGEFKNQQELFQALLACCAASDAGTFQRIYKNQIVLGRKIWTLLESLQSMASVEYIEGATGARLWKIGERNGT